MIVIPRTVIIQKRENKSVDNWITERRTVITAIDKQLKGDEITRLHGKSIALVFGTKTRLHKC